MTGNMGKFDRTARVLLGAILFFAPLANLFGIWSNGSFAAISMAIGVILMATAVVNFCPIYRIFRISTCKV